MARKQPVRSRDIAPIGRHHKRCSGRRLFRRRKKTSFSLSEPENGSDEEPLITTIKLVDSGFERKDTPTGSHYERGERRWSGKPVPARNRFSEGAGVQIRRVLDSSARTGAGKSASTGLPICIELGPLLNGGFSRDFSRLRHTVPGVPFCTKPQLNDLGREPVAGVADFHRALWLLRS